MTRLMVCTIASLVVVSGAVAGRQPPARGHDEAPVGEVAVAEGVRLHYEIQGKGRTVVVLHGGPGLSSAYLAPDLAPFADTYRFISYDQRGSGRSTVVTDPARLRLEDHVADVDAVRTHFGIDKVVLLGHSWGAVPAAFYARAHPDRVAAVILVDAMPARRTPWLEQFGNNLRAWMDDATKAQVEKLAAARRAAPDSAQACGAYWAVFFRGYLADPNDTAAMGRMRGKVCDVPPAALANAGVVSRSALGPLGDWDWREDFHGIGVPVLVVHGTKDPIPFESATEWQRAFPHATLAPIDGAGHFPQVERPDAFRKAIDTFLASVTPAR